MHIRLDHVVAPTVGTHQRNGTSFYAQQRYGDGFLNYSSKIDFYEHCVYGKQNCVSSPTRDTRWKLILRLVHSDVFRSISVPSLGGSKYYVSFIDEFSRMTWLYFFEEEVGGICKVYRVQSSSRKPNRQED